MVTYQSKVADLFPFDQPKGSCGNLGLFIPDMVEGKLGAALDWFGLVGPSLSNLSKWRLTEGLETHLLTYRYSKFIKNIS